MSRISLLAALGALLLLAASQVQGGTRAADGGAAYDAAVHLSGKIGSRPEGGRNERRAHMWVADRFREAGLDVSVEPFGVAGRRPSRNVIGRLDTAASCLVILMAHTDSVPPGHGAIDNASGVGVLVALAPEVARLDPGCDVWLVATGSEERDVTGLPYHAGAAALVRTVRSEDRASDLRFALSMDEVGFGRRFTLRSPHGSPRDGIEGAILSAANRAGVTVRFGPDSGTGNSDHREFELAGLPGAVLEVWKGRFPCHHEACDRPGLLRRGSLDRALGVAEEIVTGSGR